MKKIFALLIALIMVFTLAACGKEEPETPDDPGVPSDDSASVIETALFSVSYGGDWIHIEDSYDDEEDYCEAELQILDPDDNEYYEICAEISVDLDDPYDFREDLVEYDFNQYEYKVNNAYTTVNVGGVDLLKYENEDYGTLLYFNRIEGANASVYVEFDAVDISDSRIAELLEGITFTLEDIGNVDGPWEWEGEPFSSDGASVTAGAFTVESTFVPFEAPITTYETFDHSVAAAGDKVYVLCEGELSVCQYNGTELVFVEKIDLPEDDFERIEATADGSLWVSGSLNDVLRIKDGSIAATYEDIDALAIHPSGEWGVNFFVSNECEIVTFSGASYTSTPVVFEEADTIMHLCVDENNIYVCASAADESGHKVFVYDKAGDLQKTLCDADGEGLGSITFITQTENGYIGFDGNMRDVLLWDNDGAFIAEISDSDLFGTNYPWFCDSAVLDDGSIITAITDEREDRSATELVIFIVKGF